MNRTEQKIARAIAETPMSDDIRRALAERLAEDLADRASFSRTGWLLACTGRVEPPPEPVASDDGAWLGRLAASAWFTLRGWQDAEELEADLVDFLCSETCKPRVRRLLLSMTAPPVQVV